MGDSPPLPLLTVWWCFFLIFFKKLLCELSLEEEQNCMRGGMLVMPDLL